MSGLTSVNLAEKANCIPNGYPDFDFTKWVEKIDDWLNKNCEPGTYFTTRFMRFNFQKPGDALAFKLVWT